MVTETITKFTKDEVSSETLKYFKGDELATNVFVSKYALKNNTGEYLENTPDDMHRRMSKEFARISTLGEEEIYGLFKDFKYIIPQGSVMYGCGNDDQIVSLSNCFVVGQPKDTYSSIILKDLELANIYKRRGGCGIDISALRPRGTAVKNAANTSTGAVSFMERYSNTTRESAQNGRRGALMITVDVKHPDIEEFIQIKQDLSKVTGANISILLHDDFMEAAKNDETYTLRWPCEGEATITKEIKAKELWNKITKAAHASAEPGLIFKDKQDNYCPSHIYPKFKNITTNPCSEIMMGEYDSCRLLCLNTFSFVEQPFTSPAYFDFNLWSSTCYKAMVLSDNLVDLELEKVQKILDKINEDKIPDLNELHLWENVYKIGAEGRRTGLGLTAIGDTLAALGYKYDSQDSLDFVEELMRVKLKAELTATIYLAKIYGTFKGFSSGAELKESVKHGSFFKFIRDEFPEEWIEMQKSGRRNISWSTVAPTGSLSILAGVTSGIEPLFQPYYTRRKKINPSEQGTRVDFTDSNGDTWQEYSIVHSKLLEWAENSGYLIPGRSLENISEKAIKEMYEASPYFKSIANDISWKKRVKLQSIIQKYTTHSISSTINLPSNTTVEEVSDIYFESWKQGLKGITVYRDGCRTGVLVTKEENKTTGFAYKDAVKRPKILEADVHQVKVKGSTYTVSIGLLNGLPYELFAFTGHNIPSQKGTVTKKTKGRYELIAGTTTVENIAEQMEPEEEIITRLISTSLRHGTNIQFIVEQLDKTQGNLVNFDKAIARVLKTYISDEKLASRAICSDCGSNNMKFENGCSTCTDCGGSKCS